MEIDIVVAMTRDRLIGRGGGLPWHIPGEMRLFRRITMGGSLVMGRRTWETIGRPLPGRVNIVVSRTLAGVPGGASDPAAPLFFVPEFDAALKIARGLDRPIHVIGGTEIFRAALPLADRMHVSRVVQPDGDDALPGDTRFPEYDPSEWLVEREERHPGFTYVVYRRKDDDPTTAPAR